MGMTTDADFPAIGRKLHVRFGETQFKLTFQDAQRMYFVGLEGPYQGSSDTVQYTAVKIREQVFMVYWHEPSSGANVVHVEDFERGVVYTNIAQPDGGFVNMAGELAWEE